jgi:predicted DNA-binding transcriptional regulator AlpA
MTPEASLTSDQDQYVSARELAARWDVSQSTATNRTRTEGFPVAYDFGPRSTRWLLSAVREWEQTRQVVRAAHVTTGTRPQHRAAAEPVWATVRTTVTKAA